MKKLKSPLLDEWQRTLNKPATAKVYRLGLCVLLKHYDITPEQLAEKPLEWIEDSTEKLIHARRRESSEYGKALSPKYLNIIYSAVKSFCLHTRKIKNGHQFRQVRFDRHTRSTRDKAMLRKKDMRLILDNADLREKCIVGLYGIHGLRPSLIPQILLEDLRAKDIDMDTLKLVDKAWIMVKREYEGNKGNIDFPVILTSETARWISEHLQYRQRQGEEIGLKTQLVKISSRKAISDHIKKLFKRVGFTGRTYLLRHYANKLMKKSYSDTELKEWCMGHQGKISSIYDHEHFLSDEEIAEYKNSITESDMLIYGISKKDLEEAKTIARVTRSLTKLDKEQLDKIEDYMRMLESGKMTLTQLEESITKIARKAQDDQMETKFRELFKKEAKRNGVVLKETKEK